MRCGRERINNLSATFRTLDSAPSTTCSRAKSSSVMQGTLTVGCESSVLGPAWHSRVLSQSRLAPMLHDHWWRKQTCVRSHSWQRANLFGSNAKICEAIEKPILVPHHRKHCRVSIFLEEPVGLPARSHPRWGSPSAGSTRIVDLPHTAAHS